jgi:hypothetical protein
MWQIISAVSFESFRHGSTMSLCRRCQVSVVVIMYELYELYIQSNHHSVASRCYQLPCLDSIDHFEPQVTSIIVSIQCIRS